MQRVAKTHDLDDPAGRPRLRRGHAAIAAKVAVSAGLLAWVLTSKIDLAEAGQRIATIPAAWLALAVAGCVLSYLIVTVRWRLILGALGVRLGLLQAWSLTWIAIFFNQALPSNMAGDAFRIWRMRHHSASLVSAISGVMLDRVAALIGLAILVTAGLPVSRGIIGAGPAWYALVGGAAAILTGLAVLMIFDRLVIPLRRLLPGRAIDALASLARDARAAFLHVRTGPAVVTASVANFVVVSGVVWVLAAGMGVAASYRDILVLFPPVMLVSMLPVSFAGWGVRELAMVTALGFIGVPDAQSVALSLAFGLAALMTALPGGVIWLFSGSSPRRKV